MKKQLSLIQINADQLTPESIKTKISSHFDNLKGFYMAGHWVATGGGLPPAAYSGREVIRQICASEGINFEHGQ